jgi:hypothetical protein
MQVMMIQRIGKNEEHAAVSLVYGRTVVAIAIILIPVRAVQMAELVAIITVAPLKEAKCLGEGVEEVQVATAEMAGQIRLAVLTELIPVAAQV